MIWGVSVTEEEASVLAAGVGVGAGVREGQREEDTETAFASKTPDALSIDAWICSLSFVLLRLLLLACVNPSLVSLVQAWGTLD